MKEDFFSGVRRSMIFRRRLVSPWRTIRAFSTLMFRNRLLTRGTATAIISWEVSLSERAAAPSNRKAPDVQRQGFCDSLLYVPDRRD